MAEVLNLATFDTDPDTDLSACGHAQADKSQQHQFQRPFPAKLTTKLATKLATKGRIKAVSELLMSANLFEQALD